MTDSFDSIASAAWNKTMSPLERMWHKLYGHEEEPPPTSHFRVKDYRTGSWATCSICNQDNRWMPENGPPPTVFVCEHEPIWVGQGHIRQISTIAVKYVQEIEELE